MLLKICKCGKLIPQGQAMCEDCRIRAKARHSEYNEKIRDRKTAEFYTSRDWRVCRDAALAHYDYLDIYDLYIHQRLTMAEHVHHIVELEDDWSRRFDLLNLIPLSHSNHSSISQLYKRDGATKARTQRLLAELICRWESGERL